MKKKKMAAVVVFWCLFVCSLVMGGISSCLSEQDNRSSGTNSQTQLARRNSNNSRWRLRRRQLIGPGSYPPRCTGKCGRCIPCRPIHVTVPPGANTVAEYYPEAWRCTCGGRLYIP